MDILGGNQGMRGLYPSDVTFTIVYVSSLIAMALITLKFLLSTPIEVSLKYGPKITAHFTLLSLFSDVKGWVYYEESVGQKYNFRVYYGILDLGKIAYDVSNYIDSDYLVATCENLCISDCKGRYFECTKDPESDKCNFFCSTSCDSLCSDSVDALMNDLGNELSDTSLIMFSPLVVEYSYVEGGKIISVRYLTDSFVKQPPSYLGIQNYLISSIPKPELLNPYVINVKLYDLDLLREYILESNVYVDPEDYVIANFWYSTYCPVGEREKGGLCKIGNKLYEAGFPVLITDGYGRYFNGFLVVRVYEWKKKP